GNAPVFPLGGGGFKQARIPSERDRDRPAVPQGNAQGVLGESNVDNTLISPQRQDAHAIPPGTLFDVRLPAAESTAIPWAKSRSCAPRPLDQARTWRINRLDPHGHAVVPAVRGCRSKSGTDPFAT